jgi:hypothetical protein
MWDLSAYMKLLKQRFTQWYNGRMERKGTLWEERFKSLMVEGHFAALAKVAAYIDLNPVRAGLVNDPKDYRWCGYAAALGGRRAAREGLARLLNTGHRREITRTEALRRYRTWLFGEGLIEGVEGPGTEPIRPGFSPEQVEEVLRQRGRLPWSQFVRCRVRYFTDGAAIGSREWIDGVFHRNRQQFGPRRRDGARRLRHLADESLFGLRDLRRAPVIAPAPGA